MIINYDILRKFEAELKAIEWDLVLMDEAHYLKSADAIRTKMAFGSPAKKAAASAAIAAVPPIRAKRQNPLDRHADLKPADRALHAGALP